MPTGNQITITLSDTTADEFETISAWKGIALRTYIRNILETHHESPSFSSLLRRAKEGVAISGVKEVSED